MSFRRETLYGPIHLVDDSIQFIRDMVPDEGIWAGNSGGKESAVLDDLLKRSGVKFDSHYSVTTIDPAPVLYHLRDHYPHTSFDMPKMPLLRKLIVKGYPDAERRWCCALYKECGGSGRLCALGLRRDEGRDRKDRGFVEFCWNDCTKRIINPLLDWEESDIWQYIHENKIPYCKLYDEGFTRLGCIFCPKKNVKDKIFDLERFPRWGKAFEKAFQRRIDYQRSGGARGKILKNAFRWDTGEEAFDWWIHSERH